MQSNHVDSVVTGAGHPWPYNRRVPSQDPAKDGVQSTESIENAETSTSCESPVSGTEESQKRYQAAERVFSGTIEIPLTKGYVCLVDECDKAIATGLKWSAQETSWGTYAKGWLAGKNVYLHRLILQVTDRNLFVDHISGNTLDNRRCNLRVVDKRTSSYNRGPAKGRRFKGVGRDGDKFYAQISKKPKVSLQVWPCDRRGSRSRV